MGTRSQPKHRQIVNMNAYLADEDKIEALDDREEAAVREGLLQEILDRELAYYRHVDAYNYALHRKAIEERGLIFKPISRETAARKWDAFFASGLSRETKREIHYSDFKWHMFSYEKVAAKTGSDAKRAFDRCRKGAAYLFIQCTSDAWYIENPELLTAADLSVDFSFEHADVYIFDAKGKWAYARTHESTCGPYFLRRD